MVRELVVVCVLGFALMACAPGGSEPPDSDPAYAPIPDRDLYAQIAELEGVQTVDIVFNDTWPEHGYVGEVDIAAGADAAEVMDHVYAILRQGRVDATIGILGYQHDRQVRFERAGSGTLPELEERYGPQPGDGTPPGD